MAILPVYNSFHPVLNKSVNQVKDINTDIKVLVDNMFDTMYYADGIGLAANQVGKSLAMIIIDTTVSDDETAHHPPLVLINPVIESLSDDEVDFNEGCLSVPKFFEKVNRPSQVSIRYTDIQGKEKTLDANGILARVIQHEIDHLNGILFYTKLTPMRRTLAKNKLKRIRLGKIETHYQMVNNYNGKKL